MTDNNSNDAMTTFQAQGLTVTDPAAVAAAESAKERLRAAFVMAKQFPRNEEVARTKVLDRCKNPYFAASAEYAKPVGGRKIIGPSIRLAEEIIRNWGNIQAETTIVFEDRTIRRISVSVIDLESNTRHSREIAVKKCVERRDPRGRAILSKRTNTSDIMIYTLEATDDEIAVKEAALVSKTIRNESLRCVPSDIVEEAISIARRTCHGAACRQP